MNCFIIHHLVYAVTLCLISMTCANANVVELWGDQRINDTKIWSGNHYKIHGDLTIGQSGELTINDSMIEMMCTYDREFSIVVEGTLRTTNCVIGGTIEHSTIIHSRIQILGGWWYATDTTVQYSYGIGFHWDKPSYLRATRLMAGIRTDAIIIGGCADVIVRNSVYPIVVKCDASAGGTTILEFPTDTPINMVYDYHNCPGASYRMELINTRVIMWFLWLYNVSSNGPITTYNLKNSPSLIIPLEGLNLRGSASLPSCYDVEFNKWNRYLPTNTHISLGSLRINTLNDRVNLTCWALYLSGNSTDLTITGSTNIAELQTWDRAICRIFGEPGTHNAYSNCTTVDAFNNSKIFVQNGTLGSLDGVDNIGQITAHDSSSIVFEDCVIGYTRLIPRDGDIEFINCFKYNEDVEITELSGGGRISWSYIPLAHYEFEGNALDTIGSNNGIVYGATFVPGRVGLLGVHFDGVDDYVEIPRTIQDDFTIAFWVKTASTAGSGSWTAGNGLVDGMNAYLINDFGTALIGSKFAFNVGQMGRRDVITILSNTDINDDQWHNVAATRNAETGEMKIYVDSIEENSVIGPKGSKDASSVLLVGCLKDGINFFEGDIDDLRLYNYVLNSTELIYLIPYGLSEMLDTTLSFTTGGDAEWFCQTNTYCYDGDAAQSGDISNDQESWMQTIVSGPTMVDFYWKVSSEAGYDFLEFYIDGELRDQISGSIDWEKKSYYTIPLGSHTLKWRYVKDSSASSGSDCGWVDKLNVGINSTNLSSFSGMRQSSLIFY